MRWCEIGHEGEPWPRWLLELKAASGVYAIRSIQTGAVLYVGSSGGRLYGTITRHFQQWKRHKQWWKGQYGAGHDPGLTYQRGRCEVAIRLCSKSERLETEAKLIAQLRPRDNLQEHPDGDLEEAPF